MNIRTTWILVAALCASLALLLYPAQEQDPVRSGFVLVPTVELPRLTIRDARVRAFDQDGTPSWTMESPEIAYFRDGRLGITAPRVRLETESGSRLQVEAGEGALTPSVLHGTLELASAVDARVFSDGNQLDFSTEKLNISENGKLIAAPLPIRMWSASGETTAARLNLNLEDQVLLLGSTTEQRVITRLQPAGASR